MNTICCGYPYKTSMPLKKFYKWAIKENYCIENPMVEIKAPKLTKGKIRYFTKDELTEIFNNSKQPYTNIFKFMFFTGLRSGELCNLKWTDYDESTRWLTIRVVAANKKKRTPGNKKKKVSYIPLNNSAFKILMERKAEEECSEFIFLNHHGNRLDDDNIYRNLKRVLENESIMDASPHTFRHTFASHLVIAGVSLYKVRDLLRHESIKETEVYAHLSKKTVREAAEILDDLGES